MDDSTLRGLLSSKLVTGNHLQCALESLASVHTHIRTVIHQRRLPDTPLPDAFINLFIAQLAALDSNNFPSHVGVGEREGRVFSSLVASRHYGMSHGVGRSGELDSHQPKAAGMSLLYPLCNAMVLDVCRAAGAAANKRVFEEALAVPLSTGMTLSLVLRSIANDLEKEGRRKHEDSHKKVEAKDSKGVRSEENGKSNEKQSAKGDSPDEALLVTGCSSSSSSSSSSPSALPLSSPPPPFVSPRYVVWCRIDQKTCLKCIAAAGLEPVVVNLRPAQPFTAVKKRNGAKGEGRGVTDVDGEKKNEEADGGADDAKEKVKEARGAQQPPPSYFMQAHIDDIRDAINALPGGAKAVAAVLTTTSCFAPRLPDDVLAVARLCKTMDIPHVINNAYGLQSTFINRLINSASLNGRVDAVIQSTDKNFMVPVGGAIILGPSKTVRSASKLYPGRASSSPIVDLFITLLAMGKQTYLSLAHGQRYALLENSFRPAMEAFARARGEELVWNPRNDISFGVTLRYAWCGGKNDSGGAGVGGDAEGDAPPPPITTKQMVDAAIAIGSKLFHLGVTGPKVVYPSVDETGAHYTTVEAAGGGDNNNDDQQPPSVEKQQTAAKKSSAKTVSGITFASYGLHGAEGRRSTTSVAADCCPSSSSSAHNSSSSCSLITRTPPMIIFACAIGMTANEVQTFVRRMEELYPLRKTV